MGVGFPLLDRDLLDFSLALPSTLKLKGSQLRWFFKESLRGFLPDEILVKKKHGFGLPFGVWAVRHPGLQALSRDSLHALGERGVVRPAFVARLMSELLPAHPGYYGELVWILMMLEQWLRRARPQLRLR
jgi:asparagine synthase (glutamine-hydrolysing)